MTVKSRSALGKTFHGFDSGRIIGTQTYGGTSETIETFNHDLSFLGTVFDVGGPMLLTRTRDELSPCTSVGGWMNGSQFLPSWGGVERLSNPSVPSNGSLYPLGATAISRSLPSNPVFNGATAIGEAMQDGIPAIPGIQSWRERTKIAKNAGGEYLNVAFGWLPLVSDMRSFAKAVMNHSKVLSDYKAGSGKNTRVGYHFPTSTSSKTDAGSCFQSMPGSASGYSFVSSAKYTAYQESKTWFSGSFRYHLPASDTQIGKAALYAKLADKLFGIEPTPSAIWNASPWTWALDWFGNAGDILQNITALGQNGMVLTYGYLMTSSSTRETESYVGGGFNTGGGYRTILTEYKKRIPANPYGFGVADSSLTAAQQAVVVALGLSHLGSR